ncbi:MAG: YIP1 family protein [Terriglobales bacterium]
MADPTTIPTAPAAAVSGRRMSSLARIFGVFYAPSATFEDIAREPHFILAWVVMIVCSFLFGYAMVHRVGPAELARQMAMSAPNAQTMPQDQLNKAMAIDAKIAPVIFLALPPVMVVIFSLILAAIFLAVENFLLGQAVRYKGVLGVISHAYLPSALMALAVVLILYLRADPTGVNFMAPIGSKALFYVDPSTTSPVMVKLLGQIDLFSFWIMALLALGLAKLGAKLKFSTTLATVVGLWVLWVLFSVGLAAI